MVLEKTLESPLDCKEIQPVHSEGDQSWDFFGGNDAEAVTPILRPPDVKRCICPLTSFFFFFFFLLFCASIFTSLKRLVMVSLLYYGEN